MPRISLAVALLAFAVAGAQDTGFQRPAHWTEPVPPFRIADGLYYVGSADLTSYLLTSDDGHVLIDAPLAENVELVLDNIRALGFDPGDIRVHLASHAHFDHLGGMAAMQAATGGKVALSPADAELATRGGAGDPVFGDIGTYPPVRVHRTVEHLETISVGTTTLTAHLTPGHTRGCTSWRGKVTIAGEPASFVSVCSLSVLSGTRLLGDDPSYPGIARDYCTSAEHLTSLQPDIFLGSHASFFRMAAKYEALQRGDTRAFIDPEGYRNWVARAHGRLEEELARQGEPGGCAEVLGR